MQFSVFLFKLQQMCLFPILQFVSQFSKHPNFQQYLIFGSSFSLHFIISVMPAALYQVLIDQMKKVVMQQKQLNQNNIKSIDFCLNFVISTKPCGGKFSFFVALKMSVYVVFQLVVLQNKLKQSRFLFQSHQRQFLKVLLKNICSPRALYVRTYFFRQNNILSTVFRISIVQLFFFVIQFLHWFLLIFCDNIIIFQQYQGIFYYMQYQHQISKISIQMFVLKATQMNYTNQLDLQTRENFYKIYYFIIYRYQISTKIRIHIILILFLKSPIIWYHFLTTIKLLQIGQLKNQIAVFSKKINIQNSNSNQKCMFQLYLNSCLAIIFTQFILSHIYIFFLRYIKLCRDFYIQFQ
eukprot:TRINITY_DN14158_c0_g1_i2.p1 TRINITY_DN14158_c0_g1~~TRINITY_DN14158_c0_g1_i2.p1  ORF type:complete len:351 (-),score=-19.21 TRINITY_DN14158_c0_g1_i2:294-1346(-)